MNCIICKQEITHADKLVRFDAMERGRRHALIHARHLAEINRNDRPTALVGALPKLKSIITEQWVSLTPTGIDNYGEIAAKAAQRKGHVYIGNHDPASHSVVFHDAAHPSLKAPCNLLNRTLPCLNPMRVNKVTVKFTAGRISQVYTTKTFHPELKTNLPQWLRVAEDDFCDLIGCPQWSALKTGTRK